MCRRQVDFRKKNCLLPMVMPGVSGLRQPDNVRNWKPDEFGTNLKMKIRALLLLAVLSSGMFRADAQIIDVTQKVREMLAAYGPVAVSRNGQTNFQVLTASKVRVAGVDDVNFDAPV